MIIFLPYMYGNLNTIKYIYDPMRKVVIEFEPDKRIRQLQGKMLETIESMELIELLRLDFEKGIKIGLLDIKVKKGFGLDDVELPENVEKVDVLESGENKYVCIVKVKVPKEFHQLMKQFNLDLLWTTPSIVSNDKFVISVVGPQEDIRKFLELVKNLGEVRNISYHKATYTDHDILSVLTEKQKEIVKAAKKYGYYDYPRKITAGELSKKVGISKATVVEHLRKAEERLFENILAGH